MGNRIRLYKSPEERKRAIIEELDELLDTNRRLETRNAEMKRALNAPSDEKLADALEKIRELEGKLSMERRNSLYTFKSEELDKSNELYMEHKSKCKSRNLYYEVVPTGIGSVVYLCCKNCGFRGEIGNTIG